MNFLLLFLLVSPLVVLTESLVNDDDWVVTETEIVLDYRNNPILRPTELLEWLGRVWPHAHKPILQTLRLCYPRVGFQKQKLSRLGLIVCAALSMALIHTMTTRAAAAAAAAALTN